MVKRRLGRATWCAAVMLVDAIREAGTSAAFSITAPSPAGVGEQLAAFEDHFRVGTP